MEILHPQQETVATQGKLCAFVTRLHECLADRTVSQDPQMYQRS